MVDLDQLTDPVIRQFVTAVNAGDRVAFFALLTPGATMSDDDSERDLEEWVDREIFSADGRMEVESQSDDGRSLIVNYTNSTYGAMRTAWKFVVEGDKVSRFETGQA
ncbi:MAG: nuclear transport factor 2 family protein [Solirubrobacterales bacterium]